MLLYFLMLWDDFRLDFALVCAEAVFTDFEAR